MRFWYIPPTLGAYLLWPLGYLYGAGAKLRRLVTRQHRFSVPVISVGGLTAGGAGKTPVAIALAKLLQRNGYHVQFVSRGYRGALQGPVEVKPHIHTAHAVGDEPLLLARVAPTWVAKKRALGIKAAIANHADLIILDDGHQTVGLYKDVSFVVIDQQQKVGNGFVIPAGPLREDLKAGLQRADAIISIGKGTSKMGKPLFKATLMAEKLSLTHPFVAFCGLGFPQKFYKTLKDCGAKVVATESFPDHYPYTQTDLERLHTLALKHTAVLVTTRKDWVRLTPAWQQKVKVLDIAIMFEDPEKVYDFIEGQVGK